MACEAAIAASPDSANTLLTLAEIRCRQKRFDDSLQLLQKARQLAPYTHPPKVLLAVNCFAMGEQDRAMGLLREARAESPAHPIPALILGQLARRKGQTKEAREHLDAAAGLAIPENWPQSHRQRFVVLLQSERLQLAEQLQDVALARDALVQWMKAEPENAKLRQMYDSLTGK